MAPVAGALKTIGGKIAQSAFGQSIKKAATTVAKKAVGAKNSLVQTGKNVKNAVSSKIQKTVTSVKNLGKGSPAVVSTTTTTAGKAGTTVVKTTTDAGKAAIQTSEAAKTAKTASDAKRANLLRGMMTAASIGVGYYQVKSANKQYKDSVARTDSYNAALRAEEDAATAAKNKADAEYAARADAYSYALATSQTSTSNIYSDGYAGDSIFSSSWRHPKYSIL